MPDAFAPGASLEMKVETENISFAPASKGIEAITQVWAEYFLQSSYENIYTFCLDNSPSDGEADFRCRWLVGMSDKETKSIRVGCGYYHWQFESGGLVQNLTITIKTMVILSSNHHRRAMNWLSHLPYPWCPAEAAAAEMPPISELSENPSIPDACQQGANSINPICRPAPEPATAIVPRHPQVGGRPL